MRCEGECERVCMYVGVVYVRVCMFVCKGVFVCEVHCVYDRNIAFFIAKCY